MLSNCQAQEKSNEAELEVIVDDSTPHPLSCAINIFAWQLDSIRNVVEQTLSRTVNTGTLKRDSLCYWLDKNDWYTQQSKDEGDIEYYIEMSALSIDYEKLRATYSDDNFNIHVYMTDGHKIIVSKITWIGPRMRRLWTIESDSIKIDFPRNLERIRESFTEYHMFNVQTECTTDYIQNHELTIADTLTAQKIIEILRKHKK